MYSTCDIRVLLDAGLLAGQLRVTLLLVHCRQGKHIPRADRFLLCFYYGLELGSVQLVRFAQNIKRLVVDLETERRLSLRHF